MNYGIGVSLPGILCEYTFESDPNTVEVLLASDGRVILNCDLSLLRVSTSDFNYRNDI